MVIYHPVQANAIFNHYKTKVIYKPLQFEREVSPGWRHIKFYFLQYRRCCNNAKKKGKKRKEKLNNDKKINTSNSTKSNTFFFSTKPYP